ncbi:hypothetical protein [Pedobacter faecalis]|uniref:hypothetical protein n=1 Tax=Pedobacter faecalis TaxID=3041495 RepID=UPI00254D87C4|nr:hypothetical protein [Pedobacter sp. ELA7]
MQRRVINNRVYDMPYKSYIPKNKKNIRKERLKRLFKRSHEEFERRQKLRADKRYNVIPDADGRFEIRAKLNDTLVFTFHLHVAQKYAVRDLVKMKDIVIKLKPVPCVPAFKCDSKDAKLFVVIAEKISLNQKEEYICSESGKPYQASWDQMFEAKYKVLKSIYGGYAKDTINFTVYDHGTSAPAFSEHRYVMLFVSEHCGRLFHEKYQYFDVYPTADGRWARAGDPYRFDRHSPRVIQARKIEFKPGFSIDIRQRYAHEIPKEYPKEYFRVTRNKAYPQVGVYVEELLQIKKDGTLKARGIELK